MAQKRSGDPDSLQVEKMRKELDHDLLYKIWRILSGNGSPQTGLVWKVQQLMDFKEGIDSSLNKIKWAAYLGAGSLVAHFIWVLIKDNVLRGNL